MKRLIQVGLGCACLAFSTAASADILFQFEEVGNDVTMTSSGTFDTTGLSSVGPFTWGSVGIEEDGFFDIMGGTAQGPEQLDITFDFNRGTDFSQWASANGAWSASDFSAIVTSGTHGFATYSRDANGGIIPGLGVERADMNGALWTPDQNWIWTNRDFASLSMNVGTYSVSDSVTGETITIAIGVVPAPGAMALLCVAGLYGRRRRR